MFKVISHTGASSDIDRKTNNYYSEYLKSIPVTISLVCFLDSRNYDAVISSAQSNSLNKTILFPTTTTKRQPWCRVSSDEGIFARARLQTASVLTEFDENPVGQPKRWELCLRFQCGTFNIVRRFRNSNMTPGGYLGTSLGICFAVPNYRYTCVGLRSPYGGSVNR